MFPGHPIFVAALLFHHYYQRVPLIATHIKTSCNKNRKAIRTKARSKVVLEPYCPPGLLLLCTLAGKGGEYHRSM